MNESIHDKEGVRAPPLPSLLAEGEEASGEDDGEQRKIGRRALACAPPRVASFSSPSFFFSFLHKLIFY
jgi:hypothetical protein